MASDDGSLAGSVAADTVNALQEDNLRLWRALRLACGDAWPDAISTSQRYYERAEHDGFDATGGSDGE